MNDRWTQFWLLDFEVRAPDGGTWVGLGVGLDILKRPQSGVRIICNISRKWHGKHVDLYDIKQYHVYSFQRHKLQQGKSEGFESCDRPIFRKRPIWVKIGDVLYRETLKFDGWPWKTIGHLSFAVSSFVQHFIAIGEFKLELQSGNGQFGSNSTIFRAVWPWNLTDDLEKRQGTSRMLLQALCVIS